MSFRNDGSHIRDKSDVCWDSQPELSNLCLNRFRTVGNTETTLVNVVNDVVVGPDVNGKPFFKTEASVITQ